MHAQASWEFCWENSAAVFFPDKCELIWAGWVLSAEKVILGTEPRQELHIAWQSFEHTKSHSPLAIFRHQLGLHLPSCITETYVGLPNWIIFFLPYNKKSGGRESSDIIRKSWSTLEHSSFLLSVQAWSFSSQSHELAAPFPLISSFQAGRKGGVRPTCSLLLLGICLLLRDGQPSQGCLPVFY